jgi:predicted lipoprotein with Yx(FWY)xxD motif
MSVRPPRAAARPRRFALILVTALAGIATAALVSVAVAKTFTLEIAKNATVSNITAPSAMSKTENIAVNSKGHAVYTLSGESTSHAKCTSTTCLTAWPPLTVASGKKPTAQPGVKGKLGVWHRKGFNQVTLNGHPLYTFSVDKKKDAATGDGIVNFGGTWHVVKASASKKASTNTGTAPAPAPPSSPYGY